MSLNDSNRAETVKKVLANIRAFEPVEVSFREEQLKGGTVGNVFLIQGTAKMSDGQESDFKLVHKIQKKWERYADPDSWCREYDLYAEKFDSILSDSFCMPQCYYTEISEDETHLWMEYIEGVTGLELSSDMLEKVAEELGRFQGRLYAKQPELLSKLTNLSSKDYSKKFYLHYRAWNEIYDYIRSEACEIPKHLCDMLINMDANSDKLWSMIEQLPLVLCHRDFWVANIFYSEQKIRLIDWDTAGWGYMGEDIASLIADEADVEHMTENYESCVRAYYRGFSEYADLSHIKNLYVKEMILFMYGYRLTEWYKFAETEEEKAYQLATLEQIYELSSDINIRI